jgi:hypothetical protein
MASTYSTNLKIELIQTGAQAGTWGTTTNNNLGTALEQAIVGKADINMNSTTITLSLTNTNAAQNARAIYLNLTGTPGGAATLEVPAIEKPYIVKNGSNQVVTVKVTGQTGVAVPVGKTMWLYNDGTDVTNAITNLASGTTLNNEAILSGSVDLTSQVTGTLPIANGGTGSTSTTFVNLTTNVTGTLPVANGGTGSTSTTFVNLTTNVTGTLPVANGGTGITSFGTGVATFLGTPSSANLALAVTDETGTGALVFATSPTLIGLIETNSALGTGSGTQTFNLANGNYFTLTVNGTTTLAVSNTPSSGSVGAFIVQLTNGGAHTINYFAGVTFAAGTAPTLTASGTDVLGFFTTDGGTTWRGLVLALDIKAP